LEKVDAVIIGAGVVGLAVARAIAQKLSIAHKDPSVYVLEAEQSIGTQTSSRNSEVIHAGIYYPKGSLKAKFCVQGKWLLYEYLNERGLAHKRLGKLIVATNSQQDEMLGEIEKKACANGVDDLVRLSQKEALQLEPELRCTSALLSPSTGILDTHSYMLSLQGDLENHGGMVIFQTKVIGADCTASGCCVHTDSGESLQARWVVNCSGLGAPLLARKFSGLDQSKIPQAYYAKGNYFLLREKSPFSHLIYPVPEAAGLGVHLTLDLGGQAKFGPDVEWVSEPYDLNVHASRGEIFYEAVRTYWPALPDNSLVPGYAGIRPKINSPQEPAADFCILGPKDHGVPGLVHLLGIESPGITSSLAIAQEVSSQLEALIA
jgi:L-2-hydroxyglutarate oxidase LhgO